MNRTLKRDITIGLICRAIGGPGLLAFMLAACSQVGDFDRPTMSIRDTGSRGWVGAQAALFREEPVSDYSLTYKEEQMRSFGYRLIQPLGHTPNNRDLITEYRYTRIIPVRRPLSEGNRYYESLRQDHQRYELALWNKLISDILDDEISALRFVSAAEKVLEEDARRLDIFSRRTRPMPDHPDMHARIAENSFYLDLVTKSLEDRIAAYHHAIERAELESPSGRVAEANEAIAALKYHYQQIVWLSGDGKFPTNERIASNNAYPVVRAPLVDLSDN
ncbi:MAG: hypothetical protein JKY32_12435 [Rhizobiales bacterium]|nr:hypothetical protein [Hyphomicrobiales bacterium]